MKLKIISRTPVQIWSDSSVKISNVWEKKGFLSTDETKKLILDSVKGFDEDAYDDLSLKTKTNWMFGLIGLIEQLTPKQFCQIIPIKKDFNGHKFGCKDYFYTKDWIEKNIGWNSKIPDGFQFLMEFWADDIFNLSVWMTTVVSDNQRRQSGKSLFEKFAEENGIRFVFVDESEDGELND
ncbi:MAG: hypothetical protein LKJ22_07535 [Liquorilactobacillus nagelii]|jgi:hypothetical protein|uniref:hypothetical protein n=1 Tax=Liquorilactobacillus nagelii TaxID=82688 RepID=UPI00242CC22E|nr:hypothetical protein [Liquorilactobacillus nagelii]MCI1921765.1 hypothetical protein [Liquorilactobacillus nagelii]MCI1976715.1 hypothetical protein [Liquorilactobacillus nagelii]